MSLHWILPTQIRWEAARFSGPIPYNRKLKVFFFTCDKCFNIKMMIQFILKTKTRNTQIFLLVLCIYVEAEIKMYLFWERDNFGKKKQKQNWFVLVLVFLFDLMITSEGLFLLLLCHKENFTIFVWKLLLFTKTKNECMINIFFKEWHNNKHLFVREKHNLEAVHYYRHKNMSISFFYWFTCFAI